MPARVQSSNYISWGESTLLLLSLLYDVATLKAQPSAPSHDVATLKAQPSATLWEEDILPAAVAGAGVHGEPMLEATRKLLYGARFNTPKIYARGALSDPTAPTAAVIVNSLINDWCPRDAIRSHACCALKLIAAGVASSSAKGKFCSRTDQIPRLLRSLKPLHACDPIAYASYGSTFLLFSLLMASQH
jgi:hypothetical protein